MSALIQSNAGAGTSGSSFALAYTTAVTLSSTLVLCCAAPFTGSSVTDSQSNTWVQTPNGAIWYALAAKAGVTTVTVNYGTSPGWLPICLMEFSKASAGGGLDQNTYAGGTSAAPTGALTTPTVANEIVVAYNPNGAGSTAGSGYTLVDNSTGDSVEWATQATATAFQATFAQVSSSVWYFFTATFKPSSNTNWTGAYTEVFTLADTRGRAITRKLVETFTMVEAALLRARTRKLVETYTVAETFARSTARSVAETFSMVDTAGRGTIRLFAEALVLSDAFTRAVNRQWLEAFSVADVLSWGEQHFRLFAEALGLSDAFSRVMARQLGDAATLTDGRTARTTRTLDDAQPLTETFDRQFARSCSDSLALVESYGRTMGRAFLEALTLAETFLTYAVHALGVYPHVWLAQAWARLWQPVALGRVFTATELMIYCDPKDPESTEDFQIDWSVAAQGDAIQASTWEAPSDLTAIAQNFTATLATVRLLGGVAGQQYVVKNLITCASGQIRAQALLIPVNV